MAVEPILDRAFEDRLPTEPEPLTDAELEHLEGRNDVAGLPSTEVRRLFAEIRRLRRLAEVSRVMASFAAILGIRRASAVGCRSDDQDVAARATVQTWDGGVPPSNTRHAEQDVVALAKSNLHIE